MKEKKFKDITVDLEDKMLFERWLDTRFYFRKKTGSLKRSSKWPEYFKYLVNAGIQFVGQIESFEKKVAKLEKVNTLYEEKLERSEGKYEKNISELKQKNEKEICELKQKIGELYIEMGENMKNS